VPAHVAIIMDGNGRWAQQRGWPRIKGHEAGAESVRVVLKAARAAGVKYLTLYAFSVENWSRPKAEVDALMRLLAKFLRDREAELHDQKVRLRVTGRPQDLPAYVQAELNRVMAATQHYPDAQLALALSYGGRTEIVDAVRRIAERVRDGELKPEDIDERTVAGHLYTPDIPDPDLLIRTSGEMRVSNFLLWEISYAELYVTDTLWPDFRAAELKLALDAYAKRKRRFGRT
jgi:undecaprenyl diphosphate synthase